MQGLNISILFRLKILSQYSKYQKWYSDILRLDLERAIYIILRNINAKYQLTGIAYNLTPNLCLNEDNGNRVGIVGN